MITRAGAGVLAVSPVLLLAAAIGALRASGQEPRPNPITVQDSQTGQLVTVTPSFSLATRNLSVNPAIVPPPLTAVGYDIETGDGARQSNIGEVQESTPFKLIVYWTVTPPNPARADVVLRIAGSGPVLEQAYSVDTSGWKTGGAYRTTLDYAGKGSRYAGNATMALVLKPATPGAPDIDILKEAITIRPLRTQSTLTGEQIHATFGEDAVRLNVALRLGIGARVEIPIEAQPREFAGIGVVSAAGYSTKFDVGSDVLRLSFTTEAGQRDSVSLLYGKGTLLSEAEPATSSADAAISVERFSPGENPRPPTAGHSYVGRLRFVRPQKIRSLELEYLPSTGVLDIADIVLLADAPVPEVEGNSTRRPAP
ncbi:MAG: hypothetical protein HZB26_02605 [Candidatus Hydrogenedentes bacterium]|nr:hypothetical protein [Candidatus Hydrogenedentota bacterium]